MPAHSYNIFIRLFCFIFIIQLLSHIWFFATPWTAAYQASLSFTISQDLLKLRSIELTMPQNHLSLYCPLLFLPSLFPSIRVFSNESALCIRRTKYWSFSFSISLSNEYSGLISFRIDWFHLLAVQGTQVSSPTPQFKSINSLVLSLLYCPVLTCIHTTGKSIALTVRIFVGKVLSLLFNTLFGFVISFLPRIKYLLISSLQSSSAVILEAKKIKSVIVSLLSRLFAVKDAMILVFWIGF